MPTRRAFLRGAGGLAGSLCLGLRPQRASADPIGVLQDRIDNYCRNALTSFGANVGVIIGIVTPDNAARGGQFITAGQGRLTNPYGGRLALNEHTLFEIGSISKVFTSAIYCMLHGSYEGTLGSRLGRNAQLSSAMAAIPIRHLATYRPGLAQDNRGGVYPPHMMMSLQSLFRFMSGFEPPDAPGTCYAYSNVGWSLLGMAAVGLESIDTERYVQAYDAQLRKFCRAFGAGHTRVFHPELKPRLPMGHRRGFALLPSHNPYQPTRAPGCASGGIVSTGADMMRFLLYSMGHLPGALSDQGLALQQTEAAQAPPCSGAQSAGPVTSYGWFHAKFPSPQGKAVVLNKNGGVAGFTSWLGFTRWQGTGAAASHGLFVLSNSHASTRIGINGMRLLLDA